MSNCSLRLKGRNLIKISFFLFTYNLAINLLIVLRLSGTANACLTSEEDSSEKTRTLSSLRTVNSLELLPNELHLHKNGENFLDIHLYGNVQKLAKQSSIKNEKNSTTEVLPNEIHLHKTGENFLEVHLYGTLYK